MGKLKEEYKRVILVDDNETALFVNQDIVEETDPDVEIITFTNSQEFIDECLKNDEWFSEPTLVLLDINMPGKFGYDVLNEIEEEREEFDEMKVVMVTSSTLKRDMEVSERYRCVLGYIVKPLTVGNLKDVLLNVGGSFFVLSLLMGGTSWLSLNNSDEIFNLIG